MDTITGGCTAWTLRASLQATTVPKRQLHFCARRLRMHNPSYELAVRRRVLGDEHPDTLDSITNLALQHMEMGDFAAALPLSEEVA